jgi:hypothetical protein
MKVILARGLQRIPIGGQMSKYEHLATHTAKQLAADGA